MYKKLKNLFDTRLRNSFWMISEKGISFFGLIFVTSLVAKYLGPEIYGELALASTIFAVIKSIAFLGIDQIYFKQASRKKYNNINLLVNCIYIMSSIFIPISIITLVLFYYNGTGQHFIFFIATSISAFISLVDIKSIHLDAILLSKLNVLANIIGLAFSLLLRYILVKLNLPVELLCFPIILVSLIPYIIRQFLFKHHVNLVQNKITKKEFFAYYKYFLAVGLPLVISSLSVTIYTQCGNIILAILESTKEVGYYSIASTLAGCWYFVPVTLMMSYLSAIYSEKDESRSIEASVKLLRFMSGVCIAIIIVLSLLGHLIIEKLYGTQFLPSIEIFYVLLIANYFSVVGFFFFRLTLKYNGYKFLANKMIITCLINVPATYIFVKYFGVIGAAYAIVLSEFISNFILNFYFKPLRAKEILLRTLYLNPRK